MATEGRPADQPPAGPVPVPGSVPRQLPVAVTHYTGRVAELAKLDVLLTQDDAARPAAMVISAVAGTAGVGKTGQAQAVEACASTSSVNSSEGFFQL